MFCFAFCIDSKSFSPVQSQDTDGSPILGDAAMDRSLIWCLILSIFTIPPLAFLSICCNAHFGVVITAGCGCRIDSWPSPSRYSNADSCFRVFWTGMTVGTERRGGDELAVDCSIAQWAALSFKVTLAIDGIISKPACLWCWYFINPSVLCIFYSSLILNYKEEKPIKQLLVKQTHRHQNKSKIFMQCSKSIIPCLHPPNTSFTVFLSPSHPHRRYEANPVCADLQGQILACYKENVGKTLHCSNIAALYLQCVNNAKQVITEQSLL